jgi:hypothetical protein
MKIGQMAVVALWILGSVNCGPMIEDGAEEEADSPQASQFAPLTAPSSAGSFFCIFTGPTASGSGTSTVRSAAKSLAGDNARALCQASIVCPVRHVQDCCAGGQQFCAQSQCPIVDVPTECTANPPSCTHNADGSYTCTSVAGCC